MTARRGSRASAAPKGLTIRMVKLAAFGRLLAPVVLLFAASGGACARSVPASYTRAFTLDGRTPRALVASRETTVPLVVSNRGTQVWNPAVVHVSYHWLWLVPRELRHRSRWDLPYQEGIRTDLPNLVASGGQVRVDGRLLAPAVPGLYWLQWDMVEEGAVWFAQESPRQRRQLVVVLPSAVGWFALLPATPLDRAGRVRQPAPTVSRAAVRQGPAGHRSRRTQATRGGCWPRSGNHSPAGRRR